MLTATTIVRRPAVRADKIADTVTLDHAGRSTPAASLTAAGSLAFAVSLPRAGTLEDGDALRLDDGRLVVVRAAEEDLLEVRAENPARLLRLAWQLGGNHVEAEVGADVLHVPASPATAELVRGQGCTATPVRRAFRPEKAAHDHSTCGHDHSHDHHGHDHGHDHQHGHDDAHEHHDHAHDHGHSHAHSHDHGHDHHDHAHDHAHDHQHGPSHDHDHHGHDHGHKHGH